MKTDRKFYKFFAGLVLATGFLLLIPLAAMQLTDEVVWTLSDFILAGILLFGTGLSYLLVTRQSGEIAYRFAVCFALFTLLLLIWVNLAVGIIGTDDNEGNLMYFGVALFLILGSIIVRFRPKGMVYVLLTAAFAQASTIVIALISGIQHDPYSSVFMIFAVNGFFITLFILSALLFRYAEKEKKMMSVSLEE